MTVRLDSSGTFERALRPVPFFSRLAVKQAILFAALVLLAMTLITGRQVRNTLLGIQYNAIHDGQSVAAVTAPLVTSALREDPERLKRYFNVIQDTDDIDYVQIVDAQGRIELSSDLLPGRHKPLPLGAKWLEELKGANYDVRPAFLLWAGRPGVDIFMALPGDPAAVAPVPVQQASHLRIGIDFNDVLQHDLPRLIVQMLLFTLVVTALVILSLVLLLRYILKPLRELHLGLRAVAAGDLKYQVPVYSRDEIGRVVSTFNAMTERLREAFSQIEAMATTDSLTGLANRRVFDERLNYEAARSRRYGHSFGLVLFDLDNFKEINDKFGHPIGDETLRHVAFLLRTNVRETDLAARIGGEEFAVILPESQPNEVMAVAEKLRGAIAASVIPPKGGLPAGISITASGGAACSGPERFTPAELIASADAALYESKGRGRNCVTLAKR